VARRFSYGFQSRVFNHRAQKHIHRVFNHRAQNAYDVRGFSVGGFHIGFSI